MHWTLFLNDEDPGNDYMYTWPDGSAERRSALLLEPGAAVPENLGALYTPGDLPPGEEPATVEELKRTGVEHAFRLAPLTGPKIESAGRRRNETELPGVHGKIDLLPGIWPDPVYGQAKYEQKFLLTSERSTADRVAAARPEEWEAAAAALRDFFNAAGKMRIVFDTDPGWYRKGDCHVTVKEIRDRTATVTVTAALDPFRYERYDSAEPWLWDDFSFIDGVIREYGEIQVAGMTHLEIPVRSVPVAPEFRNLLGETDIEAAELPAWWYAFVRQCAALRAYLLAVLDHSGEGEDPGEGLAADLAELLGDVNGAYETFQQEVFSIPALERLLERLGEAAAEAGGQTETEERDALLAEMRRTAARAEAMAVENLVQASADEVNWYGVYFFEGYRQAVTDTLGNRGVLRLEGGRMTDSGRILYLRGAGRISVRLRGMTL